MVGQQGVEVVWLQRHLLHRAGRAQQSPSSPHTHTQQIYSSLVRTHTFIILLRSTRLDTHKHNRHVCCAGVCRALYSVSTLHSTREYTPTQHTHASPEYHISFCFKRPNTRLRRHTPAQQQLTCSSISSSTVAMSTWAWGMRW